MDPELRKIVRALRAQGCEVEVGRHVKIRFNGHLVATAPQRPDPFRGMKNFTAALRRAGFSL